MQNKTSWNPDPFPNTPDSIVQRDGNIVVATSQLAALVVATMIGTLVGAMGVMLAAEGLLLPGAAVCLAGIVTGFTIAQVRIETRIDVKQKQVRTMWGLGNANLCLSKHTNLDRYDTVAFLEQVTHGKNGTTISHLVFLRATNRSTDGLRIVRARNAAECRRYAEVIARALELPVVRHGADQDEARTPDELDLNLCERTQIEELPSPPAGLHSEIKSDNGTFSIVIPGPTKDDTYSTLLLKSSYLAAAIISAFFAVALINSGAGLHHVALAFLLLGPPYYYIVHRFVCVSTINERANRAACLTINTELLTIWERDHHKREKSTKIPLSELEEFCHSTTGVPPEVAEWMIGILTNETTLVASSDHESMKFAGWLTRNEKDYLVTVVRQLVARMANRPDAPSETQEMAVVG